VSRHGLDPLDAMRDQFRAAAARDIAAQAAPKRSRWSRWWSGRTVFIGVVAVAGAAGLATAGDLISVGEPKPEIEGRSPRYAPSSTPQITVQAPPEAGRELPFGVAVYTAKNGTNCALAGEVRGDQVGLIEGGVFRPYADNFAGACSDPEIGPGVRSEIEIDNHLLLFGRAGDEVAKVRMTRTHGDEAQTVSVGGGGAYLFVFDDAAHTSMTTIQITMLDEDGNVVQ
jgi:hypothetical protein